MRHPTDPVGEPTDAVRFSQQLPLLVGELGERSDAAAGTLDRDQVAGKQLGYDKLFQRLAQPGNAFKRHIEVVDQQHQRSPDILAAKRRPDRGRRGRLPDALCLRLNNRSRRALIEPDVIHRDDLARLAVFEDLEVRWAEVRHLPAVAIRNHGVHLHQIDLDADDVVVLGGNALGPGREARGKQREREGAWAAHRHPL